MPFWLPNPPTNLLLLVDRLLHGHLHLSASQDKQLEALEADFAVRRDQFETQMRLANRGIANAITVRHRYDADAKAAIEQLHQAMEGLQEATVQHVLAMRALLTPDQAQQFDRTVNEALASSQP